MGKTEIYQILNIIESAYPQINICDDILLVWMNQCRDMDYQLVRKKLDAHILKSPYPPVIAEIAAYKNNALVEKYRPSPLLVKYVKAGRLGRKSGQGFYTYN